MKTLTQCNFPKLILVIWLLKDQLHQPTRAVYENLQLGEVISSVGIVDKAMKLKFPSGQTKATVTLGQDGNKFTLNIAYK